MRSLSLEYTDSHGELVCDRLALISASSFLKSICQHRSDTYHSKNFFPVNEELSYSIDPNSVFDFDVFETDKDFSATLLGQAAMLESIGLDSIAVRVAPRAWLITSLEAWSVNQFRTLEGRPYLTVTNDDSIGHKILLFKKKEKKSSKLLEDEEDRQYYYTGLKTYED